MSDIRRKSISLMIYQFRNINFYIIFLTDIALLCLALFCAYLMRFEFTLDSYKMMQYLFLLPWMIPLKIAFFFISNVYLGMFRYTGISDMWRIFRASALSTLIIIFIILLVNRFEGYSRAVFLLDGCLAFLFIGCFRLMIRIMFQNIKKGEKSSFHLLNHHDGKPTIIIGAGNTGERILREISENPRLKYHVIGFVDDDIQKIKRRIHNVPVLSEIKELPIIVRKNKIEEILIAVPSASGEQMRHIVRICEESGVRYKTLPGMSELIDGRVSLKALRDVNYRDLLRREPVRLDVPGIKDYIKNKRILVTGAGGSIGSELCRQIVRFIPEKLILFETSEANLYRIQMELEHRIGFQNLVIVLGNLQNGDLVEKVIQQYRPQAIFHAAAYKHVPMLENNPWQAVVNNVIGGKNIMEEAARQSVGLFVLVSTDKAVRPTNVMGASKRICELLLNAFRTDKTHMMAVRFGNVVNSDGSVVPLFRDQIKRGGPVTVTHPEVTRFFMTIPEASQLILQAGALGKGGETFILDMGTPIKIVDMARDLIRLSGKEPDVDIKIQFTGLRQGEKLYEELITQGEGIVETSHEKIMVIKANDDWNGYGNREEYRSCLLRHLDELWRIAETYDGCAIREKIKEIVPEYEMQDSECVL